MRQNERVDVQVRASRRLAWMLVIAHGAGMAVLPVIAVPPALQWTAGLAVAASLVYTLRRHALLLSAKACVAVRLRRDGTCALQLRSGWLEEWHLAPAQCTVSPVLIVLRFTPGTRRGGFSVVLLGDSATPEQLRQLRVFLRHGFERLP